MPDSDANASFFPHSRREFSAPPLFCKNLSAVMLTPHWGDEGAVRPKPSDRAYARAAIEAGATAVIGTHPHVLQPWERVAASDGREGLVIYSTGNFLSNQHTTAQRSGIVALLELTRVAGSGKARLTAAGYVPTWVEKHNDAGHRIVEQVDGISYVGVAAPGAKIKPPSRRAAKRATPEMAAPDGLAATLKLLPTNRVSMANFRDLPRGDCPLPEPLTVPPVAPPEVAPDAAMVLASAGPLVAADDPVTAEEPVNLAPTTTADAAAHMEPAASTRFDRVAGAISVAVAAVPHLPLPPPRPRLEPVLRARRLERPGDATDHDLVRLDMPVLAVNPPAPAAPTPPVAPLATPVRHAEKTARRNSRQGRRKRRR